MPLTELMISNNRTICGEDLGNVLGGSFGCFCTPFGFVEEEEYEWGQRSRLLWRITVLFCFWYDKQV